MPRQRHLGNLALRYSYESIRVNHLKHELLPTRFVVLKNKGRYMGQCKMTIVLFTIELKNST